MEGLFSATYHQSGQSAGIPAHFVRTFYIRCTGCLRVSTGWLDLRGACQIHPKIQYVDLVLLIWCYARLHHMLVKMLSSNLILKTDFGCNDCSSGPSRAFIETFGRTQWDMTIKYHQPNCSGNLLVNTLSGCKWRVNALIVLYGGVSSLQWCQFLPICPSWSLPLSSIQTDLINKSDRTT